MKYEEAGVSLARAEESVSRLRRHVESTFHSGVVSGFGHFAGAIAIPGAAPSTPLMVASMDGVGTKLLLVRGDEDYSTVAGDLIRHGANDCLALGARPFFFLDYIAWGKIESQSMEAIAEGLAEACKEEGCVLLGGETAEMPDLYSSGDFDLAGCMIATVARDTLVDGKRIERGDQILALPSNGLHTNGYSMARRLLSDAQLGLDDILPGTETAVGTTLLQPHRSYTQALLPLIEKGWIRGLAHVTGGGIQGNLVRILPDGCLARVKHSTWTWPAIFSALQELGDVSVSEMESIFNLGVGYLMVVSPAHTDDVLSALGDAGESPWGIGEIADGTKGVEWVD